MPEGDNREMKVKCVRKIAEIIFRIKERSR